MRGFILFLLVAGVVFVYLRQERNETPKPVIKTAVLQSGRAMSPAPLTPAPRGQASEYNYMKRALDRAADVRDQSRARTGEAQEIRP